MTKGLVERWIEGTQLEQWLVHKKKKRTSKIGDLIWQVLFHAITWAIWKERNLQIFEEKNHSLGQTLLAAKQIVWDCIRYDTVARGTHWEDLVFNWEHLMY